TIRSQYRNPAGSRSLVPVVWRAPANAHPPAREYLYRLARAFRSETIVVAGAADDPVGQPARGLGVGPRSNKSLHHQRGARRRVERSETTPHHAPSLRGGCSAQSERLSHVFVSV